MFPVNLSCTLGSNDDVAFQWKPFHFLTLIIRMSDLEYMVTSKLLSSLITSQLPLHIHHNLITIIYLLSDNVLQHFYTMDKQTGPKIGNYNQGHKSLIFKLSRLVDWQQCMYHVKIDNITHTDVHFPCHYLAWNHRTENFKKSN